MAGRGTGCLLFLTTPISARFTAVDVPLWSAHHVLRPPALKFLPRVLSTSRGCYISFYASDLRPPAERFPGFPHEQGRRRPARRYCGRWARTRTLRALRHRGKTRSKALCGVFEWVVCARISTARAREAFQISFVAAEDVRRAGMVRTQPRLSYLRQRSVICRPVAGARAGGAPGTSRGRAGGVASARSCAPGTRRLGDGGRRAAGGEVFCLARWICPCRDSESVAVHAKRTFWRAEASEPATTAALNEIKKLPLRRLSSVFRG